MTIQTVKSVATRFLTSDKPEVMALKGAWGVGKTHAWGELLQEVKGRLPLKKYAYVSLFGATSIAEVRTAIFTKARAVELLGERLDAKTINQEWDTIAVED